jgi:hypothetical protein
MDGKRPSAEPGNGASRQGHAQAGRERKADERERRADERERAADERERELDERARALGYAAGTLAQRTREAIERSRALLAASAHRLDRQEAAVNRSEARRDREQAEIDRAAAETERGLAAQPPNPGRPVKRSWALREQALAAMTVFATTEEEVARVHDKLAASHPGRRDEYQRIAEEARNTARKAHEFLRGFTGERGTP